VSVAVAMAEPTTTSVAAPPPAAPPASAAPSTAIGMTAEAAAKIRALVAARGVADGALRVKVVGGGCSGLTYKMDLDTPRDGDKVFEHDGARLVVDRKSFLYLKGTILDYKDDLMSSGFNLQNPNVKRSCGCGSSFVV
jgi:iron-sulfur cluster assembly protein